MNATQQRMVKHWIALCFFLVAYSALFLAPEAWWRGLGAILSISLMIWISVSPELRQWQGYGTHGQNLSQYVSYRPWLKFWLIGYCMLVVPLVIHQLLIDEGESLYWYFWPIFGIVAPVLAVSEYERFKSAGDNS